MNLITLVPIRNLLTINQIVDFVFENETQRFHEYEYKR